MVNESEILCKLALRRPASARGEPQGNGDTNRRIRRMTSSRTELSVTRENESFDRRIVETGEGCRHFVN